MIYKGEKTKEISFPLGGIGTGCIGLAGNGRLIDWEIFNRPNKGFLNGMSHFAVKAESGDKVADARVLHGDQQGPYMGHYAHGQFGGFGFGTERDYMTGVPHFRDAEFNGEFPMASLRFVDKHFPGVVSMGAFNPFIPLNDKDSTIPGAFFTIEIKNNTDERLKYTVCGTLRNPAPADAAINSFETRQGVNVMRLMNGKTKAGDVDFGEISLSTDEKDVSYQEYWYRGGWFDNLGVFWRDFTSPGGLKNRRYPYDPTGQKTGHRDDLASIAAHFELEPGAAKKVRFLITWNYPNAYNYWKDAPADYGCDCECGGLKTWKNYYAVLFNDSVDSALYSFKNWDRLYAETETFKNALFASSLPESVVDAVSANISILKSPTCLRLENGKFYGWEGCHGNAGCCEGSCTHVWNYAYALPFLFPALERSMRELNYKYNDRGDGGMGFRLQLPIGSGVSGFRPCVDGQFGDVLKTYREWKVAGDTEWLKAIWPAVKKSIEFAWSPDNKDAWDKDKDGIMEGRQHHTLDMELFEPNSWLNGFYLGGLKAGAEMAEAVGEPETAAEYMALFENGKKYTDTELFNGEYYYQKIDLKDKSIVDRFAGDVALHGVDTLEAYWNSESDEIKYQFGEGVLADQMLAQWHANISGLGEIYDPDQVRKALQSIFKYNFKEQVRDVFNPCRIYALNDESGTVVCDWPEGRYKPITPAPYCEECWPGVEYPAGALMIQSGLIEEGMAVVKAVRDRFDGSVRNPWNEFECGSNYARSMASYSLLHAFSGFGFDMVKKYIRFDPVDKTNDCQFFFSLDSGWGMLKKKAGAYEIEMLYGMLTLNQISLPQAGAVTKVTLDGKPVGFSFSGGVVDIDGGVRVEKGAKLLIS